MQEQSCRIRVDNCEYADDDSDVNETKTKSKWRLQKKARWFNLANICELDRNDNYMFEDSQDIVGYTILIKENKLTTYGKNNVNKTLLVASYISKRLWTSKFNTNVNHSICYAGYCLHME